MLRLCWPGIRSRLASSNLVGTIPPEIGSLTTLRILCVRLRGWCAHGADVQCCILSRELQGNKLTGTVPPQLASLQRAMWLCVPRGYAPSSYA